MDFRRPSPGSEVNSRSKSARPTHHDEIPEPIALARDVRKPGVGKSEEHRARRVVVEAKPPPEQRLPDIHRARGGSGPHPVSRKGEGDDAPCRSRSLADEYFPFGVTTDDAIENDEVRGFARGIELSKISEHEFGTLGDSEFPGELARFRDRDVRSEEHTSELQSRLHLVCRLLLEKKK